MRVVTILGEILPVLGTVGLLGLWLYQQTGVERRTGELRALSAARGEFQTYQSNNALFNAIGETLTAAKAPTDRLLVYQTYNYELGLAAIEQVLPKQDRVGIPPAVSVYDDSPPIAEKMNIVQKRLELLQEKLIAREAAIRVEAEQARRNYIWAYVGFSAIAILGALGKLADKFISL